MRSFSFVFCAVCAMAQSGIDVPSIGTITDLLGSVRPVYGVAGNFWLGPPTGQAGEQAIQNRRGPVLLIGNGVVYATKHDLILRRRDGPEVRFELAGVESIASLGPNYAAIRAGDSIYALRLEAGRENLFLLPGSIQ